jgi:hypothetical protein
VVAVRFLEDGEPLPETDIAVAITDAGFVLVETTGFLAVSPDGSRTVNTWLALLDWLGFATVGVDLGTPHAPIPPRRAYIDVAAAKIVIAAGSHPHYIPLLGLTPAEVAERIGGRGGQATVLIGEEFGLATMLTRGVSISTDRLTEAALGGRLRIGQLTIR